MGGAWSWIQRMGGKEEVFEFPDSLEKFGYKFNEEGKLRQIETDEPFEFEERTGPGSHSYNQKRYNALGDIVTEHLYQLMEKDCKLQKAYIPVLRCHRRDTTPPQLKASRIIETRELPKTLRYLALTGVASADVEENEPQTFVFISGDLYTNDDKLLLLIHGSGAVRAGQWARRLIINDGLEVGSQLPYIKWARENGYAVVVANTNHNHVEMTGKSRRKTEPVKIRGSATPEEHMETVWHEFVQRSRAKHVAIVAHSFGGIVTLQLAMRHIREFEDRVFAIALTDSVHNYRQHQPTPEVKEFYVQHAINWASAREPLDTPLLTDPGECPVISAGTDRHEYTTSSAMQSIFTWLAEKHDQLDPAKKRVSMGEPLNAHYHRPSSSEAQHLVTRSRGEGEESTEQPVTQSANQVPSTGEGEGSVKQPEGNPANQDADLIKFDDETVKSASAGESEKERTEQEMEISIENSTVKAKSEL